MNSRKKRNLRAVKRKKTRRHGGAQGTKTESLHKAENEEPSLGCSQKVENERQTAQLRRTERTSTVDEAVSPGESTKENLPERARAQWQFGDWESLTCLKLENIEHHPDRALLALLAAAGRLQTGAANDARQYVRLAQDWGAEKRLINQVLIAGVNSLARSALIANQQNRAVHHF